jgi:ApaG protein
MGSKISSGVLVSSEYTFQEEYSAPMNNEFMFAYRITIKNNNSFPIRLLSRHWHIFEGNGCYREVEGEGVVGAQPVIGAGKQYQYVSGCNLKTEMGRMHGYYIAENMDTQLKFSVPIPAFELIAPLKMN